MSTTVKLITVDGEERIVMLPALRHQLESLEASVAASSALMRDDRAQVMLNNGVPALVTLVTNQIATAPAA